MFVLFLFNSISGDVFFHNINWISKYNQSMIICESKIFICNLIILAVGYNVI
jgi:hypothetical protein